MKNSKNKTRITVLAAMSGGVDSSVAALLLKKQGYKVIGAFMKCFSDMKDSVTGECNWIEERRDAQKIAAILDIPFVTFDFEKSYKELVLEPMYKSYSSGLTPNPDISCNTQIKFPLLWKEAKKLGADYIATGHYARTKKKGESYQLLAGKDKSKDQSYFIYELSQDDLSHTLFPVGNYKKSEVRRIAKMHHFPNWNKQGTSGICFIGEMNMQRFLQKKIKPKKGKVIMPDEKIVGTHQGISYYTIGQRAGQNIGIEITKPLKLVQKRFYVAEKRKNNVLVVAPEGDKALKRKEVIIKKMHFINQNRNSLNNLTDLKDLRARIRHLGRLHDGRLKKEKGKYVFNFDKPIEGVAEGQHIALYNGNEIVGGGEMKLT